MNRELLTEKLDGGMRDSIRHVLRPYLGARNLVPWARIAIHNRFRAEPVRRKLEKTDYPVPRYLLVSVTHQCNLRCAGCFAKGIGRDPEQNMDCLLMDRVFDEAKSLGIPVVFVLGGEPFTHPDLLSVTRLHREVIFPVFTNGLLIGDREIRELRRQRHVLPMVSIEGRSNRTDERRGSGVGIAVSGLFAEFRKAGLFFGVSVTVTNANLEEVVTDDFVRHCRALGAGFTLYSEYESINGDRALVLSDVQRNSLVCRAAELDRRHPGLILTFPGDEESLGGCLAAGRGFAHVNADGGLEPCPMAPWSDVNVADVGLKAALSSRFLRRIREDHESLKSDGACALWENREWTRKALEETHRTAAVV